MADVSRPLRRSRTNRQIARVVGGLAEYFRVDATLLRVIYVVGCSWADDAPSGDKGP